jgi:hypothetical protein
MFGFNFKMHSDGTALYHLQIKFIMFDTEGKGDLFMHLNAWISSKSLTIDLFPSTSVYYIIINQFCNCCSVKDLLMNVGDQFSKEEVRMI